MDWPSLDACHMIDATCSRSADHGARTMDLTVIPFQVKRVYYLYGIQKGAVRGGHAHRELCGVVFAAAGKFVVRLHDGISTRDFPLDSPHRGVFIPHMIWREVVEFSDDAVLLALASGYYTEDEMIRNKNEFLNIRGLAQRTGY